MTVEELIEVVSNLEQAQYNSQRIRQELSDTLINMVQTMLPDEWETIVEPKEQSYQQFLQAISKLKE